MTTRLAPGDPAPAFTLLDQSGREVALADFAGRRVVVYFYPAAMTPGCTTQAVDFTAAVDDFAAAGVSILGVSPDAVGRLATFTDQESVKITLLSDPDKTVLHAYGAFGERMLYGKSIEGVIRSTFVVDVDAEGAGVVALAQYNVRAKGHVAKLSRELGLSG